MTEEEFLFQKIQENEEKIEEYCRLSEDAERRMDALNHQIEQREKLLNESAADFLFIPKDNPDVHEMNGLLQEKSIMKEETALVLEELKALREENVIFKNLLLMLKKRAIRQKSEKKEETVQRENTSFVEKEENQNVNICSNNQLMVELEQVKQLKNILSLAKKISLSDSRRCSIELGKALSILDQITDCPGKMEF